MFGIGIFIILTWLSDGLARARGNPKLAMAERMTRQGLYLYALDNLDTMISKGMADADVYAYRGNILTMRGQYYYAVQDFEEGLPSLRLQGRDGEAYAYAKFILGDCDPSDLDILRHFGTLPKPANVRMLSTLVEIARYCDDPISAFQFQNDLATEFPQAVKTHLATADLALDQGDLETAWRSMFNAQLFYQYVGARDVFGRLALVEGRYEDAYYQLDYINSQRVSDRSMILYGLAMLLSGNASDWVYRLERPKWRANENPHLLYLRLWGLEQVGDQETFLEEKEWYDMVCDPECTQRVQRNLSLELQAPLPFTF